MMNILVTLDRNYLPPLRGDADLPPGQRPGRDL